MAEIDDQKLKDFLDGLKKIVNDRSALKKEADLLVAREKNVRAIDQQTRNLKKAAAGDAEAMEAVKQFTESVKDSKEEHKEFIKNTKSLREAFTGLGRAAFAGEGSISSFTSNFKDTGRIGDAFGFLGNRLDVNIETFRQLTQVGASFGQSIVDLRQTAATAALPLDDFAKLIGENSRSLAALFGSTTQGAKQISLLAEAVRTQGIASLAPLGFTVDEINETLLLNLERQRRTNIFDRMSNQQRIDSAINFAKELDRLARLTGAQRSELQAQIEQAQSNERFQAFLQNATDETRRRLEGFSASIGTIAPGLSEGFQDLIANAGVPVTESALALVQNIPQARNVINDLISGAVTSEQALVRLRDISAVSVERFRKATVTGQVEFTALQGDIINLARRVNDVDSIFAEQGETADRLTQGLTTFEDASKRLSGQFQQIETGLLAAFGPALGGLSQATQGLMKGVGAMVAGLAQVPALTGSAIAGALAGKFLFDKVSQIGIVASGTAIGTGTGLGKIFGNLGIGRMAGGAARMGGRLLSTGIPGAGAAIGVASSAGQLMNKDKSDDTSGVLGLGGAVLGGLLGIPGGLPGILLGSALGSAAGQGIGALIGSRQYGTMQATGQPFEPATKLLQVEKGERVLNTAEAATVNQFDTSRLEQKMDMFIAESKAQNTKLEGVVNGVNTGVAVQTRSLKAQERLARRNPQASQV